MTSDPATPHPAVERALSGDDADKIEAALQEVYALASGKRRWTMRVPPEDTDSDLIICAGLDVAKEALAALDQARAEIEGLHQGWDGWEWRPRAKQLEQERDQARAENDLLRNALEPGKSEAIIAAMFSAAEERGHPIWSSKHALTFLIQGYDQATRHAASLEGALRRLVEACTRLCDDDRVNVGTARSQAVEALGEAREAH